MSILLGKCREIKIETQCLVGFCASNNMEEVWIDIPGFEDFYKVSNLGNVKGIDREVYVENSPHTLLVKTHLLTPQLGKDCRYVYVSLSKSCKSKRYYIHRLVATLFVKNKNGYHYVKHIDGDVTNNKVTNLKWVISQKDLSYASTLLTMDY